MSSTDELIAGLRAQGRPVAEGEFTLDRDRALEKIRRCQLPDPHGYVLELVQAAVLLRASRIDLRVDADDVVVEFDSPIPAQALERLDDALFEEAEQPLARARRQLAVALNAVIPLEPRWVRVDSSGLRLERIPGKPDRLRPHPGQQGARIHLKERFRPRLLARFLRNLFGRGAEARLLRERCRWAEVPVRLNGGQISRGSEFFGSWGQVALRADGMVGQGSVEAGGPSEVVLLKDGVWIETHRLEEPSRDLFGRQLPFRAVVDAGCLRKDASHTGIVRDEAFPRVLEAVTALRPACLARLCQQLGQRGLDGWAWLLREHLLSVDSLSLLREGDPKQCPRCLARLEIWPTATGDLAAVSFDDLLESLDSLGFMPYAVESHAGRELPGARHVLLIRDNHWEVFGKLSRLLDGRIRNVNRRLAPSRSLCVLPQPRSQPALGLASSEGLSATGQRSGWGEDALTEREASLLRWVRRALLRMMGPEAVGVDLDRVILAQDDDPGAPVTISDDWILLQRGHPLLERALREHREEPLLIPLIGCLVAAAVNEAWLEVTDRDESEWLLAAAEFMRGPAELLAPPPACDPGRELAGLLEFPARVGEASGWAFDPSRPDHPPLVKLYVDGPMGSGTFAGSVPADRTDFPLDEGAPAGARGFRLRIPDEFQDGRRHSLFAYALGEHTLRLLPGSPRHFASPSRTPASPIGWLDSVDEAGRVSGWTLDPNTPDQAIGVHFYLDGTPGFGEFVGGLSADQARPDVNHLTGYPGDHGFTFPLPQDVLDGHPHALHAYALDPQGGHNPELSGSPLVFRLTFRGRPEGG